MEHHFDIDIAKEYGIAEAVLINHFQFCIAKNKANMVNFHDGKFWTFNTKSAIQELFPYLSYDQVRRALERLVEKGVLVTGNYNKIPTDRTLWYSFTDEFERYLQKCQIELAEMPNAKGETNRPIPYNSTTYNTPNNPTLFNNKDSVISPKIGNGKSIDERKAEFHESLRPYLQEYGEDMIIDFFNYWVEENKSGTKMRFEMERVFELKRRLITWKRKEEERKFRNKR